MSGAEPIIAAEAAAAIGATEAAAATAAAAEAAAATAAAAEAATAMQAAQTAATAANTASPFLTGGIEQAAAEGMRNFATQSMAGLSVPGAPGFVPPGPYELAGGSLMPGVNPALIAPNVGKAATGLTMMQGLQAARAIGSMGPKQQTTVGMQMRRGQPVNLMQPASLLEQKRKRNPIISLL